MLIESFKSISRVHARVRPRPKPHGECGDPAREQREDTYDSGNPRDLTTNDDRGFNNFDKTMQDRRW